MESITIPAESKALRRVYNKEIAFGSEVDSQYNDVFKKQRINLFKEKTKVCDDRPIDKCDTASARISKDGPMRCHLESKSMSIVGLTVPFTTKQSCAPNNDAIYRSISENVKFDQALSLTIPNIVLLVGDMVHHLGLPALPDLLDKTVSYLHYVKTYIFLCYYSRYVTSKNGKLSEDEKHILDSTYIALSYGAAIFKMPCCAWIDIFEEPESMNIKIPTANTNTNTANTTIEKKGHNNKAHTHISTTHALVKAALMGGLAMVGITGVAAGYYDDDDIRPYGESPSYQDPMSYNPTKYSHNKHPFEAVIRNTHGTYNHSHKWYNEKWDASNIDAYSNIHIQDVYRALVRRTRPAAAAAAAAAASKFNDGFNNFNNNNNNNNGIKMGGGAEYDHRKGEILPYLNAFHLHNERLMSNENTTILEFKSAAILTAASIIRMSAFTDFNTTRFSSILQLSERSILMQSENLENWSHHIMGSGSGEIQNAKRMCSFMDQSLVKMMQLNGYSEQKEMQLLSNDVQLYIFGTIAAGFWARAATMIAKRLRKE